MGLVGLSVIKRITRLISIVSKPIEIVVVDVVIVFSLFLTKKKCDPKTISAHKTVGLKVVYPKKFK